MNMRSLAIALAALAIGFAAGAWWMDARRAAEIAELEAATSRSMVADLAALAGAVPGPALPAPPPGAGPMPASGPVASPAAAPSPARAAESRLMPEPPASWMTLEQQRAAAVAYREWVRDAGRLATERAMGLNAELFMIESQDPAWGAQMESKVRASMAGSPVFDGAQLEAMECRVTVCRATVRFIEADSPRGLMQNGGRSPWSEWRNAQIQPIRSEINDGVPGFRATVYLGEDFDQPRLPRGVRAAGPGGP